MSVLPLIEPTTATGPAVGLLAAVQQSLGVTPNMTKAMANSPALLKGYLEFWGALGKGVLTEPVRERIALVIAQKNGCSYCLSAHTYLAEHVAKVSENEIIAARKAESNDSKIAALLAFAALVNETRGAISERDVIAVRATGATDEEIAETIGHVALNVLTNYFNKANNTDVDFPLIEVHSHE